VPVAFVRRAAELGIIRSRIAGTAAANEVLVSDALVDAAGELDGVALEDAGVAEVKNVATDTAVARDRMEEQCRTSPTRSGGVD
jgi:class 3 adenylate cyclase